MNDPHTTDQRLTDLEIKASFMEDLVDQLNLVIIGQQQQLDTLRREVHALRHQTAEERPLARPGDELPPHY